MTFKLPLAFVAAAFLAAPALAQQIDAPAAGAIGGPATAPPANQPRPAQGNPPDPNAAQEVVRQNQLQGRPAQAMARASKLVGMSVSNMQGEAAGTLTEVVIEPQNGQVKYAVLSTGQTLGVGGRRHAIPIQAFHLREEGDRLVLNVPAERLKEVAGFEDDNLPDGPNLALVGALPEPAMGEQPRDADANATNPATAAEPAANAAQGDQSPAAATGAERGDGDETAMQQRREVMRNKALGQNTKIVPLDREHLWAHKASALRGTDVRAGNENVGEIDDLVFDLPQGRVAFAVLTYGGTLGVGGKRAAVPWHAIELNKQEQVALLGVDRGLLDRVAFEADREPDFNGATWRERTRAAFGDDPRQDVFGYSIEGQNGGAPRSVPQPSEGPQPSSAERQNGPPAQPQ